MNYLYKSLITAVCLIGVLSVSAQDRGVLRTSDFTNDESILNTLEKEANLLVAKGGFLTPEVARLQIRENANKIVEIRKVKANKKSISDEEIASRLKRSLLSVNVAYLCGSCDQTHIMPASGYVIDESGIFVTNHHVVENYAKVTNKGQEKLAIFVRTSEGKTYAVSEVLSCSAETDLAVVKLDVGTDKLIPLPMGQAVAQGAAVYVLSNPSSMFSYFSKGLVARNTMQPVSKENKTLFPEMEISADYAAGSSGAAVVDSRCNLVGTVSATRSIYHNPKYFADLQMVVRSTKPVTSLYQLIRFR